MPLLHECPDAGAMERFLAGTYTPSELEEVAGHIEVCPDCARTGLTADDTMTAALRGGAAVARSLFNPRVQDLLLHFQELSPALPFSDTLVTSDSSASELSEILAPAQSAGELGRLGSYRVLGVLGQGGMGMVLRAEDTQLQRPLAIKVMLPRLAADRTYRQRFLREARAAAGVKHDHVVTIYQVGEDRGHPFLAMEFLEGESLDALLKREKALPIPSVLHIGREIAEGLAAAHDRGLIHRDIKPGNIWLERKDEGRRMKDDGTRSGTGIGSSFILPSSSFPRVKILDFGLAHLRDEDVRLTLTNAVFGTPGYMAPEQAKGLTDEVDARSDLFSLGCVLYQMSTGEPPFKGNSVLAVLSALECRDPAPPSQLNPSLPPRLGALIERLLAKDRTQRPETARVVADELTAIAQDASFPGSAWERTAREALPRESERTGSSDSKAVRSHAEPGNEKRRVLRWAAAACVLVVGGWLAWDFFRQPEKEADTGPVSAMALVTNPDKLSFTIETPGHRSKIAWLRYSPDGKWLASGSQDGTIRLWDPKTGEQNRVFVAGTQVESPAWSPDSKKLAVRHDVKYWLWDVATGKKDAAPFDGHIVRNGWLADGRYVVSEAVAGETFIKVIKVTDGAGRIDWQRGPLAAGTAAVTPDGKRLVAYDGTYDLDEYKKVGKDGAGWGWLSFSPDRTMMANTHSRSNVDGDLVLRDTASGKEILRVKDAASFPSPWSRDNKLLCLRGPGERELHLIDPKSGNTLVKSERLDEWLFPYGNEYFTCAQDWSPDGTQLALGRGFPGVVLLFDYDAKAGTLKASPLTADRKYPNNLPKYWLTWSDDGDTLFVRRDLDKGQAEIAWKLAAGATGELRSELGERSNDRHYFNVLSPDRRFLTGFDGNELSVRDYASKAVVARFTKLCKDHLKAVVWSADGALLAVSGDDKTVRVLDVGKKKLSAERQFEDPCNCLAFSLDGKKLFVCQRFNVQSWEWATGKPEALPLEMDLDAHLVTAMAWSRDGKTLATGHRKQVGHTYPPGPADVLLWSVGSTKPKLTLSGHYIQAPFGSHRTGIVDLAFAPDGKTLASLGDDGVRLWQVEDGKPLGRIIPLGPFSGLAISAAGDFRSHPAHVEGLVYVVQTAAGQQTLTPAEFERRFRKNDPKKVDLRAK